MTATTRIDGARRDPTAFRPAFGTAARWILFACLVGVAPSRVWAAVAGGDGDVAAATQSPSPRPTLTVRAATGPIRLDGVLDEPDWALAPVASPFHRYEPLEGGPTLGSTEARIVAGPKALYFAFTVHDDPAGVRAHVSPRESDTFWGDDRIVLWIDPWLDHQRLSGFAVNPLGIQGDFLVDATGEEDSSWDGRWDAVGQRTSDGYVVEVAIPFSTLRFPRGEVARLGVAFGRKTARAGETDVWPDMRRAWGPLPRQMATLDGVPVPRRRTRVELWPAYVASYSAGLRDEADPASGLAWDPPAARDLLGLGLGVRWLATRNIVFDVTLNPDYSQVESDPFQVDANLRHPLALDERRPFFQEGKEYFDTHFQVLYTRTISQPLAGLKVTGREGRVGLGVLSVLDLDPQASLVGLDYDDPREVETLLKGRSCPTPGFCDEDLPGRAALATVAHLTVDVGNGSSLGVTWSEKDLLDVSQSALGPIVGTPLDEGGAGDDGEQRPADPATSRVGAATASLKLGRNAWLDAEFLASSTRGGGEKLDGVAWTTEGGLANRQDEFSFGTWGNTPDFRMENGYYTSTDGYGAWLWSSHRFEPAWAALPWLRPGLSLSTRVDTDGHLTNRSLEAALSGAGRGSLRFRAGLELGKVRYSGVDFQVRTAGIGFSDSPAAWLTLDMGLEGGEAIYYDPDAPFLGKSLSGGGSILFRPTPRFSVAPELQVEAFWDPDGNVVYHQEVIRVKQEFSFTRSWSLRAIEEWDTYDRDLSLNLLVAFVRWPGTAVYAGAGATFHYPDGALLNHGFQAFLKLSYVASL